MSAATRERFQSLFQRPAGDIYDRIVAGYAEPARHYHTLDHISACLGELDRTEMAEGPRRLIELALWCDLRVAAEDAIFGVFCRRFGVPLCDLGTVRLPRMIGHGRAMDLILTGRAVEGPEALQLGLVNRVVAPGSTYQAAVDLAHQLARLPQFCLRSDRMSALEQWGLTEEEAALNEARRGRAVVDSGETRQGALLFAEGAGRGGSTLA